ncbi:hypothetical protein JVT61DRAFT_1714 [Boletus reticuloceps]|uniref:Uncharacterized protein n=1 Tax=Boletus reticuloceps TaxID=495285 RepID=A0A8I3AAW9_9AGAM|nr:hypothetical protein JVT61DRAFT_1714 [Boletus reticuloceps]
MRSKTLSILKYIEEYDRLNVSFDRYTGESEVGKEWMDTAIERLDQLGLISNATTIPSTGIACCPLRGILDPTCNTLTSD